MENMKRETKIITPSLANSSSYSLIVMVNEFLATDMEEQARYDYRQDVAVLGSKIHTDKNNLNVAAIIATLPTATLKASEAEELDEKQKEMNQKNMRAKRLIRLVKAIILIQKDVRLSVDGLAEIKAPTTEESAKDETS